jgi:hypothetical protein
MRPISPLLLAAVTLVFLAGIAALSLGEDEEEPNEFKVYPIGYVRKSIDAFPDTPVLDIKS